VALEIVSRAAREREANKKGRNETNTERKRYFAGTVGQ
jgi:hypothetical protein